MVLNILTLFRQDFLSCSMSRGKGRGGGGREDLPPLNFSAQRLTSEFKLCMMLDGYTFEEFIC